LRKNTPKDLSDGRLGSDRAHAPLFYNLAENNKRKENEMKRKNRKKKGNQERESNRKKQRGRKQRKVRPCK